MVSPSRLVILSLTVLWAVNALGMAFAQEGEVKITYEEHIKPIFREHCTVCHSQGDASGGLALDDYAVVLTGGSSGEVVVAGRSDASRLYALMTHRQQPAMPPDEDPVESTKLELIKTWIEQGMPENSGSKIKRSNQAAAAMLGSAGSIERPDGPPPMPESILRQVVVETERPAAIAALAASPWAPLIAVGGQEQVLLVHADSGDLLGVIPFPEGEPQSLNFTRDGKQLLIGGGRHSHSGCAVLVDIRDGQRIAKVGDELDIVLAADISPDKSKIAIAGPQKVVRIFDSLSGELVQQLKKHTDWVYTLRFSPDGILLASGDRSNGVIVWEANSGNLYADLGGHQAAVTSIDFRADSNAMLSASMDGSIKLWDMMDVKEIKTWTAHEGGVNSARYSLDGNIVSAGSDRKVKLWSGTGELQKEFTGLAEMALRACVCSDAATLIAGDWSGEIRLWKLENPEAHLSIEANPPSIQKRLEQAERLLGPARQYALERQEFVAQAVQQLTSAAMELDAQRELSKNHQEEVNLLSQQQAEGQAELTELDREIASLKKQLQVARQKRETIAAKLSEIQETQESLNERQRIANEGLSAAELRWKNASEQAAEAERLAAVSQSELASAQARYEQALADQTALQQQTVRLQQSAQEAAQQARALAEQLLSALAKESEDNGLVDTLSAELAVLRERMAEVEKQLHELDQAYTLAAERMQSTRSDALRLREETEAAEQAAVDAQQMLDWFRSIYRNTP